MSWENTKTKLEKGLAKAIENNLVDKDVIPYLNMINSQPGLMTSSSCYGRNMLLHKPNPSKKNAFFLNVWHRKISFEELWDALENVNGVVWFKTEPLILHISCKDMENAKQLLDVKMNAGLKRGGIFHIKEERVQIELMGTAKLDLPVKNQGKILVTKDYMKYVVDEANEKFGYNERAWGRFEQEFKKIFR